MKKLLLLIYLVTYYSVEINAQGLTSSSEGKSAILLNGAALGFDVSKPEISFGYTNLYRTVSLNGVQNNNYPVWGFELKAVNASGIANIFDNGELVPKANGRMMLGYSWTNAHSKYYHALKQTSNQALQQINSSIIIEYKNEGTKVIDDAIRVVNAGQLAAATTFSTAAKAQLLLPATNSSFTFEKYLKTEKAVPANASIVYFIDTLINRLYRSELELQKRIDVEIQKHVELEKLQSTFSYTKLTLFGFGYINYLKFSYFDKLDQVSLLKSFRKITSRGGDIGVGVNYHVRNMRFGLTYSYLKTNNFDLLSNSEFSYKKVTTVGGETLTQEQKVSAYSGDFGEFEINELNFDALVFLKLDSLRKSHLAINPYIRSMVFSRDKSIQPDILNVGVGAYFFRTKGTLLGGIYVELPDINNNIEKLKPEEERNLKSVFKRVTFGLTAKLNFKSMVSW